MSTVKVVTGTPTSTNAPVTQTSDAHASAIPQGAVVLGSSGNQKPSVSNGVAFQTCTAPVHIDRRSTFISMSTAFGSSPMA